MELDRTTPEPGLLHDWDRQEDGPQPIGEILAELLAQYRTRFPEMEIALEEVPVAVA